MRPLLHVVTELFTRHTYQQKAGVVSFAATLITSSSLLAVEMTLLFLTHKSLLKWKSSVALYRTNNPTPRHNGTCEVSDVPYIVVGCWVINPQGPADAGW